ncbi:MAG: sugar phosphate isomerase/epimerase [Clostridia bacterium]|nr:sugar phosphate isomerase/epimerase [Clostridia bacterium]
MKRRVGVSTDLAGLNRERMVAYREHGIEAIEVSVADVDYDGVDPVRVAQTARDEGIEPWSFHLRFWPFEVYTVALSDEAARERAVAYAAKWIRRAGEAGFRYAVIHPSGEPIGDADRESAMQASEKSLRTLAAVAREAGIALAVENLPRTCLAKNSAELSRLIAVDPDLRVCFDTNHLLQEPALDFMEALRDRIVTLHVSDYDFINERHWLPGHGLQDWAAVMHKLDEISYDGVLMYETRKTLTPDGEVHILTPADYRANADWLESL